MKFLIACLTCVAWLQLTAGQTNDPLNEYFQPLNAPSIVDAPECSKLEGSAKTCLACYTCDSSTIQNGKKRNSTIFEMTLRNDNCTAKNLCCIQYNLLVPRSGDKCGESNPEGIPRRRRSSLRSVLEMEFPWRAWVYSNGQPLCAATYIDLGVKALVTTASCVSGHQLSSLSVKFSKTQQNPYPVKNVNIHEEFNRNNGGNNNDIATLTLSTKPEERAHSVCLPNSSQYIHGTSCITVSASETYINTVIPRQMRCSDTNSKLDFESSLMCTFLTSFDYTPEYGAGLYCLHEQSNKPTYILHGIFQDIQSTPTSARMSVYTNISSYTNWIYKTLQNKPRNLWN